MHAHSRAAVSALVSLARAGARTIVNGKLFRRSAVLSVAFIALGCGGGGSGGDGGNAPAPNAPQELSCADFASVDTTSVGRLSNNTWNRAAAASFTAKQCLLQQGTGASAVYGWSWSWPANGTTIYAYPELVYGWKPWDGGASNTSQLPARISSLQSFRWAYNVDIATTGKYNLASSMWITRTGATGSSPSAQDIATEFMIWTRGHDFNPGGQMIATATIGSQNFEVWYAQDWGDVSGANPNKWSYVAYRAVNDSTTVDLDIKAIVDDAVSRGLVNPQHHISNIELGNEIMSGSGSTWIKSISLSVH